MSEIGSEDWVYDSFVSRLELRNCWVPRSVKSTRLVTLMNTERTVEICFAQLSPMFHGK